MKKLIPYCFALLPVIGLVSCGNNQTKESDNAMSDSSTANSPAANQADWGELDGHNVYLYSLTNNKGTEVKISNYGGTITSWITPDKNGNKSSIVLGFDSLKGYQAPPPYFGATIGRYGNRIAKGKFTLDGHEYTLATNNNQNHLHGGNKGFDKVVWDVKEVQPNSLSLHYLSKDGEEGYPGNLDVTVKFTLTDEDEVQIVYDAETDKPTPVNLTNHSYFNLTGNVSNTILNHVLMINADKYTPVDTTLIPTGELKPVAGTPFDFRKPKRIGADIDKVEGGYDHNYVLSRQSSAIERVAVVSDTASGRQVEVFTTEPGLQFYSGNFLDGTLQTSNGTPIKKHTGMCLETQHYPNSPNETAFPTTILKPGQKYHTETTYKVSLTK